MTIRTTKVDVYLVNPDGSPATNLCFFVKPLRASFWSTYPGVALDVEMKGKTDSTGHCILDLVALPYPYELTYDDSDEAIPGAFLFYVPDVDYTVNFQDLIVTRADSQDKYVDNALNQIIAAKVETKEYAAEAKTSAETAKQSEQVVVAKAAQVDQQTAEASTLLTQAQQVLTSMQNTYQQFTLDYAAVIQAAGTVQASIVTGKFPIGKYILWTDASGKLRIKEGMPSSDTDGVVVGDQTAS